MATLRINDGATNPRFLEVLGNTLDQAEGARTIHEIRSMGNAPIIGIFGELRTESLKKSVSLNFSRKQLNTVFDVATAVTGDGAVSAASGIAVASSASIGTAEIKSLDVARYTNGTTLIIEFTAAFDGTGTGYAGGIDANDAVQIKSNGTNLYFGYLDGGVEKGSLGTAGFDLVDTSGIPGFDVANLNIYIILFGYLGVASPTLLIRKNGKFYHAHSVVTEGELTEPHVKNPVFSLGIRAVDGMSVSCGSIMGGTLGDGSIVQDRPFSYPNAAMVNGTGADQGSVSLANTNVKTCAIFRIGTTFNGVSNKTRCRLVEFSLSIDPPDSGDNVVIFQLVKNPTLSGAPTYADVSTGNSVVGVDHTAGTGASVSYASGGQVFTLPTEAYTSGSQLSMGASTVSVQPESLGTYGRPGDVWCLLAKNRGAGTVVIRFIMRWVEEF